MSAFDNEIDRAEAVMDALRIARNQQIETARLWRAAIIRAGYTNEQADEAIREAAQTMLRHMNEKATSPVKG